VEYPSIKVEELTDKNTKELVDKYTPRGINLGDVSRERMADALISKLRGKGGRRFLLRWTGDKVPTGASVLGNEIAWTQHGLVQAKRGEQPANIGGNMFLGKTEDIGTYDRLVEFGGESGNEQMLIVYLYPQFS
jgi:hypothetical protein